MTDGGIRTVVGGATAEFTVNGSRFIGHVAPAQDEDEAGSIIEEVRQEYPDATHVVWAYRLAGAPVLERADDAGEPGGSAGQPVLGVLQGDDLENVVAVVVRYYGGTNLGYGGLVRAYARAVKDALAAATVEVRQPTRTVDIGVTYDDSGTVRGVLESEELEYDATYGETVSMTVEIPDGRMDTVLDRLRSATSGRIETDL